MFAVAGGCILLAVSLSATPARAAAELAAVSGELPASATAGSPATVVIYGIPDLSQVAVGDTTTDVVLATETVTSGTAFSLVIPDSADAESVISPTAGTINIHTVATSASGATDTYSTVAASLAAPGTTDLGTLAGYQPAATGSPQAVPSATGGCGWLTLDRVNDHATRIGEMHVTSGTGVKVSATYTYDQHADSTFEVGVSATDGQFSAGGTVTITNSTGTNASLTRAGFLDYIDAHYDYVLQKDVGTASFCGEYRVMAVAWDGDVIPGSNQPPTNPYGSCRADPWGYVQLPGGATWTHTSSTGVDYGTVANVFGFNDSGHTGYSTSNAFTYNNPGGGKTVFLCSLINPVSSWHVIFNALG